MSPTPEARAARERRMRLWISGTATVAIAAIVGLIYLGLAQREIDKQRKHDRAQFVYAHNHGVCGWQEILGPLIKSYRVIEHDPTVAKNLRAVNKKRADDAEAFLGSQVTIPATFNCKLLPKKPPL